MLHISTILKHYKRRDIQEAMIKAAENREVAVKFGDKGFGKRPDVLVYPNDVLEFAKKGATSFHVSEERWQNVMQISTGMRKKELDELRKGWDLVIDIDCPLWDYSKYITHLVVQELKKNGVRYITVKFSGNKGFHIGVPFESFPKEIHSNSITNLFPEGVRRIAHYIADKIKPQLLSYIKSNDSLFNVSKQLGISESSLYKFVCSSCKKEVKTQKAKIEFECKYCGKKEEDDAKYKLCEKCNKIMERVETPAKQVCIYCKSENIEEKLDLDPLLQIDTVLISSRHLYRMPYSLHEKSGLCSIPINPEKILSFDKKGAKPSNVNVEFGFLDKEVIANEAQRLILEAFDYNPIINEDKKYIERAFKNFDDEDLQEAIPEEFFPPCIHCGLLGLRDGKKRFMFVVMNFLSSCGYEYDKIEELLDEWNNKNPEPLREVLIKGHVRYAKQHKKKVMPPNCDNKGYYKDMGICKPDGLCGRIKNPVQYSKRKAFIANLKENSGREKLTDEQKEMRRTYREKIKEAKSSDPLISQEDNYL